MAVPPDGGDKSNTVKRKKNFHKVSPFL